MRIVVFGASGRTGRALVDEATAAGHEVTAVVRDGAAAKLASARLAVADPLDAASVARTVEGHDAIVSALGHRRAALNPFARVISPLDLLARSTENQIAAARAHGISRLFVVSLHGAGDSLARTRWLYRLLVTRTQIRHALADSNRMEALLAASDLDWLAVRPVTLTDAPSTKPPRVRPDAIFSLATIPRATVARYLLAHLTQSPDLRTPSLST